MRDLRVPKEFLLKVEKPARYIGEEFNVIKKDITEDMIRMALCFPDVYEIGMSHLGMQILYNFINKIDGVSCERVYTPWVDMEEIMREEGINLFALESQEEIKNFDFIGVSMQYEMAYTNLLNLIDLSGLEVYAKDRGENDPLIFVGGPCTYNTEPIADFVDFAFIGEGEAKFEEIFEAYKKHTGTKKEFLETLAGIEGMYVPSFYDVKYKEDGKIESITKNNDNAPEKVKKVVVKDMDEVRFLDKPLVPYIRPSHDRAVIELFRGCIRGCRFCQAGMIYRPVREKEVETLLRQAETIIDNTGYEELGLLSLSTSDYKKINDLMLGLIDRFEGRKVNLSLPSMRIDAFSLDLMEKLSGGKKSSLTFAPEAGTQRMRDVINKGITEEEILAGSKMAFEGGWDRVKLYFMMGQPTETDEDIIGIYDIANKIVEEYYSLPKEMRNRAVNVTMSTACFVPKPFTPFQWEPQDTMDEFMRKQRLLKDHVKKVKQIKYNYHDSETSVLEGVFARGDRRLSKVIYEAFKMGSKYDAWGEFFDMERWNAAFENAGLTKEFYVAKREYEEILPWDIIDIGVTKKFLINESKKAHEGVVTKNCREGCSGCGATCFDGGVCFES
ncbi:MAG: TIGR03960 family B12-binding radical SAM protein [Clostridia bacterium]|nr:TIGR03960 family B12-binding radical SAM protein [Clostridia bacterium]